MLPLHPPPPAPLPAPLLAQSERGSPDRSRSFPLRREGGGTRGACVLRLVAHLVPEDSRFDPGPRPILAVIEEEMMEVGKDKIVVGNPEPEPVPLVLRWAGGERIEPARRGASLRLLRLSGPVSKGLWESFPACGGSAEPMAPPALSLLGPAAGTGAADRAARAALDALWRRCGERVATAGLLESWSYPHLAKRLPASLPVVCVSLPPSGG
jgi:hypothetical protein